MGMVWRSVSGARGQPEEGDVTPDEGDVTPSLDAHKAAFEGNAQKMLHIARDTPELLRQVSPSPSYFPMPFTCDFTATEPSLKETIDF